MDVITRADAITRNLRRYYTGEPCIHGHVSERLTSSRQCLTCARSRNLDWAQQNKPRLARNRRARRLATPDRHRTYDRERYQSDPRIKMLSAAKQRSKAKGLHFDITAADITIPTHCPLLEIPLEIGSRKISDNSPTLDRVHNDAGYVIGNVIVISHLANRCKGSLQSADLLRIAINLHNLEQHATMPEWMATEKGLI